MKKINPYDAPACNEASSRDGASSIFWYVGGSYFSQVAAALDYNPSAAAQFLCGGAWVGLLIASALLLRSAGVYAWAAGSPAVHAALICVQVVLSVALAVEIEQRSRVGDGKRWNKVNLCGS